MICRDVTHWLTRPLDERKVGRMSVPRRRSRPQSEARLLQAALQLFEEGGPQAVAINAWAERAQLDKVLLYRYFNGMEGLWPALIPHLPPWPDVAGWMIPSGSESERLSAAAASYGEGVLQQPRLWRLFLWAGEGIDNPWLNAFRESRRDFERRLVERLLPEASLASQTAALAWLGVLVDGWLSRRRQGMNAPGSMVPLVFESSQAPVLTDLPRTPTVAPTPPRPIKKPAASTATPTPTTTPSLKKSEPPVRQTMSAVEDLPTELL